MSRVRSMMLLLFLACLGCGSSPVAPAADADLNILFIGNSLTYTNDLPSMLERMLESYSDIGDVRTEAIASPNFGLMDHWARGGVLDVIDAGGWDYVVIQQGPSATEGRPSLLDYSQRFADRVQPTGARLALYMVWPAGNRFFDFAGVSDSYATAAENTGSLLFPAGEAWLEAWAIDPDIGLYGPDRFHPSLLGTHLAALVMFEQISGRDPRTLPSEIPTPTGIVSLPIEVGDVLHDAAAAANAEHAR